MPYQLIENSDDLLHSINVISQNNFLIPTKSVNEQRNLKPSKKGATESVSREASTGKPQESTTLQNSDIEKESNAVGDVEVKREEENGEEIENEHVYFEELTSSNKTVDIPDDKDFNPSDESPDGMSCPFIFSGDISNL